MARTSTLSKKSDLLPKVAIAFLSPLLLILLLEGLAYIWERGQANGPYAWELVASRRIVVETFLEPGAGYTLLRPNSTYEWQGIPVEINSHGLRGPEIDYKKPAGTIRILNLGDSVAMGWGVREEESYGRRLGEALNGQAADGQTYEVINAGTPGWNLENELAYLEAEGLKYDPDLILLDLTIANDIKGKTVLAANGRPPLIEWLRANTYFWPFLTLQLRSLEAQSQGQERIDLIDPPTAADKYFPLDPEAAQWTELWNEISAINGLGREIDVPVVLVLFPLEFQVVDEDYTTLPQTLLAGKAAEAGIPLLDLLPIFRQACLEKPAGPCRVEDRYLFADVWMHPSPYGHDLTATELKTFIEPFLEVAD